MSSILRNTVDVTRLVKHDFEKLILDTYFVETKINSLSLTEEHLHATPVIQGLLYAPLPIGLSVIGDIQYFLRTNTIDMLLLIGENKTLEVYHYHYESHITTKEYIEVRLKTGKVERIFYKN